MRCANGRALGVVDGDGIAVVEMVSARRVARKQNPAAVVHADTQRRVVNEDLLDGAGLGGDGLVREWCEGDEAVACAVAATAGRGAVSPLVV